MRLHEITKMTCQGCQQVGHIQDMTAKHFKDSSERIVWCVYCGSVCTLCLGDPISLSDWYTPELTCDPQNSMRNPHTGRNT